MSSIFDIYAEWTDKVAQYPKTAEPAYLALGIADEFGELVMATNHNDTLAEAGDVLWYCARYARLVLGVPFSHMCEDALTPGFSNVPTSRIMVSIGLIAGVEKKRIRDGEAWDDKTRSGKHNIARIALMTLVAAVADALDRVAGLKLEDAIRYNMMKLSARLEADTIKGDGDNR